MVSEVSCFQNGHLGLRAEVLKGKHQRKGRLVFQSVADRLRDLGSEEGSRLLDS